MCGTISHKLDWWVCEKRPQLSKATKRLGGGRKWNGSEGGNREEGHVGMEGTLGRDLGWGRRKDEERVVVVGEMKEGRKWGKESEGCIGEKGGGHGSHVGAELSGIKKGRRWWCQDKCVSVVLTSSDPIRS